jgi:hypothetical protein
MRAVRKQAMHGLSGASLRRHRSRRLAPLQEEALLWRLSFVAFDEEVTRTL